MKLIRLSFVFAAAVAALQGQAPKKSAFDKPTFEAYLRHMELWVPQINVRIDDPKPSPLPGFEQVEVHLSYGAAVKDELYYVSKDGQQIIKGTVHNIAQNPFKTELDKLKTDLVPSFGAAGAPVVLVVFSDFQCPLCKEEAKTLRENVAKTFPSEVRVYFKDFPLEAIHPWAKTAAIGGRCILRQSPEVFWMYHDWIYEHQGEITVDNVKQQILGFSKDKPIDALQMARCLDTGATEKEVNQSIAEGRALQIDATPTAFLNGRRLVGNTTWQNLEQIIKIELEYQKTAKDAGEKCCEVKIPSPVH